MMTNSPERATISINEAVTNFIEQNDLPKHLKPSLIKRLVENVVFGRIEAPESNANRMVYVDSVTAFLYEVKK